MSQETEKCNTCHPDVQRGTLPRYKARGVVIGGLRDKGIELQAEAQDTTVLRISNAASRACRLARPACNKTGAMTAEPAPGAEARHRAP
jgi:hypothetical protein